MPPVTFTLDSIKAAFGNNDQAEWLWQRIIWSGNQTDFGNTVRKAVEYVQRNPSVGPLILQCAENDLNFHQHLTDTGFSFHERRFPVGAITATDLGILNPMLVSLYRNIFDGTGFSATIHHDTVVGNLTRAKWNKSFWDSNRSLGFCPACNGQKPDLVRNLRASDIDHFFPKEKYPFLSVHPDNLIPTCLTCNTKAHRDLDPINDHTTETLLDTFHPYHCPAIEHIELRIYSNNRSGIKITIQELDGTRAKRVNNLVRVFDLEARWTKWFAELIDSVIETLRCSSLAGRTDLRDHLQVDFDNCQYYRLARPQCFVYAGLLEYVLNDPQEFDDLCTTFGL